MKSKESKYGQFFTKSDMCKSTLEILNNIKEIKGNLLEPSFGCGNFVDEMSKYNNVNIEAIEIDTEHFTNYKNEKVKLYNLDFIDFKSDIKYDFIVGNPPYIELCYSFYDKQKQDLLKKRFKGISNGRINLVHIFMEKSFEMINDDGVIAYLLPSAILTSPTYKSIRKKIFENFNVEYIKEDVNFPDVAIKVCLLIIRKTKNTKKYFYINNDNYFLMENYLNFSDKKTLKDLNFKVSIGEVVWNQQKDLLTEDSSEKRLIYSDNLDYDKLNLDVTREGRKRFIKNKSIKYENCILFPRTVSKKIKFFFVKDNTDMIFENHVLVLSHNDMNLLEDFYKRLKSGNYDTLLKSFFNSSNLTKSELLSLPF